MTVSSDARAPLVRAGFLKWSSVAFVLLLPLVAHAVWDYVETRRLAARMDAIVRQGQPITMVNAARLGKEAADAERFYRAAAALTSGLLLDGSGQLTYRLNSALHTGNVTPALLADIRARVDEHRDALSLADRAAALPFDRFAFGTTPGFQNAGLIALSRLCEMRATERALAGDGDAAFASLYTDVRLERAMGRPPQLTGLTLALERAHPSADARARLAQALAEIDRDDRVKREFVRGRAYLLDRRGISRESWPMRPWMSHRLTQELDVFSALVSAAEQPEPGRLKAVIAVGEWPGMDLSADRSRWWLETYTRSLIREVDRIRCARRLVAGEMVNCQL